MREMSEQRTTMELMRDIAQETSTLVRKEVELARQEIVDAISTRMRMAAGFAVAALFGLLTLMFAGLAARDALATVLDEWAASLIVTGAMALLALTGLLIARASAKQKVSLVPEETKRTVKEDLQWAKEQLKR